MIREAAALLLPGVALAIAVPSLRHVCHHSRIAAAALAVSLGIGLSSVTTTGLLAIGLSPGHAWFQAADASIWVGIGALGWWRRRRGPRPPSTTVRQDVPAATALDWIVRGAFGVTAVLAIGAVLATLTSSPHGEWDAWAIWNLHARFLFRGGDQWRDVLTIGWSQPDYPLLLPASVARLWAYAGRETAAGPALLATAFAAVSVIVVMSRLGLERRRAWIAGAVLVGSGSFLAQVPSLCADVPVASFMVMTLAVAWGRDGLLSGREGLRTTALVSGATAAMAAWTKNEGLVFLLVVLLFIAGDAVRRGARRQVTWWMAGAAPALMALAWFKLTLAPTTSLLEGQSLAHYVDRVLDIERHAVVVSVMARHLLHWGAPFAGAVAPLAGLAAVGVVAAGRGAIVRTMAGVVGLMFVSYYLVYLTTPFDINWHVSTSFDRLLVQVWPALVLTAFLDDT